MSRRVIVIGAGAAGMMAAGRAAERGLKTILIDRNKKPGRKLAITGKGRCNITNSADIQSIIDNTPGNGNFLYSALYNFSNEDIINFFNRNGVPTKIERGGRVFPLSDRAEDVVECLFAYVNKNNAEVMFNTRVKKINVSDGQVTGITTESGRQIECSSVVLATGGCSYPGTGSTGDGYEMAKEVGHSITQLKPSLIPLIVKEEWVKELQGLTLKNVKITLYNKRKKKIYDDFGEMLFTHFGVSGPLILSASRHVLDYGYKDVELVIDLKPALTEEKLDERVQRDFHNFSNKQFKNALNNLLPKKLIPVIVKLSGIQPDKPVNQITKEERRNLVNCLKKLSLNIIGSRPLNEAIVTAGGVSVDEINPSTMESKIVKGLYFAGEIIDVDAYTGGFNLTIAFSTGYLAGTHC